MLFQVYVLRAASEIGKDIIGSLMGKFIVPVCFSSHSRLKPSIYVFRVLEEFTSVLPSLFSNKRESIIKQRLDSLFL